MAFIWRSTVSDCDCILTPHSTKMAPVEDAEAAFHFDGEVDVAGSVDQVDRVFLPLDRRGGW